MLHGQQPMTRTGEWAPAPAECKTATRAGMIPTQLRMLADEVGSLRKCIAELRGRIAPALRMEPQPNQSAEPDMKASKDCGCVLVNELALASYNVQRSEERRVG